MIRAGPTDSDSLEAPATAVTVMVGPQACDGPASAINVTVTVT